jgi:glycosyltransferase involved in cell wall biosynthesis
MRKQTILLVGHGSGLNGAERCLHESASALKRLGHRVHILLPNPGPLETMLRDAGVEAVHIRSLPWWIDTGTRYGFSQKLKRTLKIAASVVLVFWLVRRIRADIVVSNTIAIPNGAFAASLARKPHVWYVHELGDEDHGYHFLYGKSVSRCIIDSLSSIVLANSQYVAAKFSQAVNASKIKVIPYEVRVPANFTKASAKKTLSANPTFIIAGRVTAEKGQLEAVCAMSHLIHGWRIKNIKLQILGAHPLDPQVAVIRDFIAANHLTGHVHLLPFSSEPLTLIRNCDALLMCSRCEAFGRVTVEAMKLGLPVIAANTGGSLELVQHGINGLLYEWGNPLDLAQQILKIISEPEIYPRLSRNAASFANTRFSATTHAQGLQSAIASIEFNGTRGEQITKKLCSNPLKPAFADEIR